MFLPRRWFIDFAKNWAGVDDPWASPKALQVTFASDPPPSEVIEYHPEED